MVEEVRKKTWQQKGNMKKCENSAFRGRKCPQRKDNGLWSLRNERKISSATPESTLRYWDIYSVCLCSSVIRR